MQNPAIDTRLTIETPEGVAIELPLAGPLPRAMAWLLDFVVRLAVFYLVIGALQLLGTGLRGSVFLLWFGLEWLSPILFEALWQGQTLGKRALGLQVIHDDGSALTWPSAILRNLLRAADFLPIGYLLGLLSLVFSRRFQRLGDRAAGTLVIYRQLKIPQVKPPAQEPLKPRAPLSPEEQRALVEFACRSPNWSEQRREEVAAALQQALGLTGAAACERILGLANTVAGGDGR